MEGRLEGGEPVEDAVSTRAEGIPGSPRRSVIRAAKLLSPVNSSTLMTPIKT